jgi:hypothetical protein
VSLTAPERETIITFNDEDDTAEVWTAQRPWITKLKKNPAAILVEEGKHEGSAWARFTLPKELVSLRSKRRAAPSPGGNVQALEAYRLRKKAS